VIFSPVPSLSPYFSSQETYFVCVFIALTPLGFRKLDRPRPTVLGVSEALFSPRLFHFQLFRFFDLVLTVPTTLFLFPFRFLLSGRFSLICPFRTVAEGALPSHYFPLSSVTSACFPVNRRLPVLLPPARSFEHSIAEFSPDKVWSFFPLHPFDLRLVPGKPTCFLFPSETDSFLTASPPPKRTFFTPPLAQVATLPIPFCFPVAPYFLLLKTYGRVSLFLSAQLLNSTPAPVSEPAFPYRW